MLNNITLTFLNMLTNPIAKDAELRNVINFNMQNLKTLLSFKILLAEINIYVVNIIQICYKQLY